MLILHISLFPCWFTCLHINFFIVFTEDNDPSKSSVSSGAALDAILLRLPTCVNKDFIDEVSRRNV